MTSVPMVPTKRPNTVMATPFSGEPRDIVAPASRPSSMMALISVGPNLKATTSSTGDMKIMIRLPSRTPKTDHIRWLGISATPKPYQRSCSACPMASAPGEEWKGHAQPVDEDERAGGGDAGGEQGRGAHA